MTNMTAGKALLMTGGTGFIGTHLCRHLAARGYRITVLTRQASKWQAAPVHEAVSYVSDLAQLDTSGHWHGVINLAGEPLNSGRWNPERKALFRDSRVNTTLALRKWVRELECPPEVFLSASAIGWYGHWQDQVLDESSDPHDGYSHQLCRAWEEAAASQPVAGCRDVVLRIGIVLGVDDGPLPAMLQPAALGLGGPMGSGHQWWSWIHIYDLVRLIQFLLENDQVAGIVNGTAPNPVTQKTFAKVLGKQLRRPSFMPLPGFVASLLLGEFADEVLLHGQRVVPGRAMQAGFSYSYPELSGALHDLLG
jgi:uncharacterized protein (TIGR01777 family)